MITVKSILSMFKWSLKPESNSPQQILSDEKPVFITLAEARKDPQLVKEMSDQVNEAFQTTDPQMHYVAGIILEGHQYYISGTHSEWLSFYGIDNLQITENAKKMNKRRLS